MSSAIQLDFTLRTSANVKTVHLLGSWDQYQRQIPLSKLPGAKPGSWKGRFRFQPTMINPGARYWYYYIMDGYHVSHDPAAAFTVEPTTGRKLNILDVPASNSGRTSGVPPAGYSSTSDIAKGRALSPSRIQHPRPSKPYESRHIRESYCTDAPTVDALVDRFGSVNFSDSDSDISSSPPSSAGSSLSSRSGNTSPSSVSSLSDSSSCSCNRYGITRSGEKVKIDCGGRRCGYTSSDDDSDDPCSSDDEEYRGARPVLHQQHIRVRR
ncbi:hypothetical protein FQN57_004536 [Myotisia sp. PD_48]|nr:hypothetical protein FQN57_004536 [Myotisia sp. PD_48]